MNSDGGGYVDRMPQRCDGIRWHCSFLNGVIFSLSSRAGATARHRLALACLHNEHGVDQHSLQDSPDGYSQ